ncbi:MAG: glycosyltransferase [Agathobacter sp.]|nr:glycosyltransferase [Agathobacter sp.]
MKKVSIIIPVYNVEKYLKRCLDSVCNQAYENLEILIVNDGSKDGSLKICNEYANKYSNIKLLNQENQGLSESRNNGLKAATGEYVMFVDSDDWLCDGAVNEMVNFMEENQCDVVSSAWNVVYEKGKVRCGINEKMVIDSQKALAMLIDDIELKNYAWAKLYKKELFDGINYPKGQKFEDINTTYKIFLRADKVGITDFVTYNYFQRLDGISKSKEAENNIHRCIGHEKRFMDLSSSNPQLINSLLVQYFYSYRKLVLENKDADKDSHFDFFVEHMDRNNEKLNRFEKIEVSIIQNRNLIWKLRLYFIELIRKISKLLIK